MVGIGYDVHKLVENRKFILGGVEISSEKGLLGHSDADVLTHAVIDALLGAAALGDIGTHFPDTEPKYKGISSLLLLEKTVALLKEKNYTIVNIDSTVVCQKPKLMPYIGIIRQRISSAAGIDFERVSVKAKTEEGLGFTGEMEGVKAYAVAQIEEIG